MAAPDLRALHFAETDALASALRGGSIALTPVEAGPFDAEVIEFALSDLLLQIGRSAPVMMLGEVAADAAWIQLPLSGEAGLLLNGRPVSPGDLAVNAPGASLDGIARVNARWALVVLSVGTVAALLPPPRRLSLLRPGVRTMLRANPQAWGRAVALMEEAAEIAAKEPDAFVVEEARRSLRASVLDMLAELLAGPWEGQPTRVLRTSRTQHRIVRLLDERLRAAPQQALRLTETCAALGLSRRRVDAAFRATFAMGLRHYTRLRCLTMAHNALRSGRSDPASLKEFAASFGFRDEGYFMREYRHLFGKTPSLTLSQAEEQVTDAERGAGGVPVPV